MAVQIDLKRNSRISRDKNGIRAERIAIISGVTGNVDALLLNALNDASMPQYGDAHPSIAGIAVQHIDVRPAGGGKYHAVIAYYNDPASEATASNATASVSGATVLEQTENDAGGFRLEARFADALGVYDKQKFWTCEVERPRFTLEFAYVTSVFPKAEIDQYLNTVNSAVWNGYSPKTVLCTAINVSQAGNDYRVRFSFSHNPDTWQFVGAVKGFALPLTAHSTSPDADIDLNTGIKLFDVYRPVDFSPLNFTLGGYYGVMSGTAYTAPPTETDIASTGGKTIILTLVNDTWAPSGAAFDAVRADIREGLVSNNNEAAGWNARRSTLVPVANVVRSSNDQVTITLAADAGYSITESETIAASVPAAALQTSSIDLRVDQKFTITAS